MLLSVFTPSHDPRFLNECWASLAAQSYQAWEWIVVLNGGAEWTPPVVDPRVRVESVPQLRGVGAAKSYACGLCTGDVLVELDHDDLLTVDALAQIDAAFTRHPKVGLVYSDCAQITEDGTRDNSIWDTNNGWRYREATVRVGLIDDEPGYGGIRIPERDVLRCEAMDPSPHNMSYIWFEPNHVRAFRRSTYGTTGGYDPERDILDDQDLICRLWQATDFHRIPKVLYLQRCHAGMTQRRQDLNDRIQRETMVLYDRHIEANALAWARRKGLEALDLGGALNPAPGFTVVDQHDAEHVDLVGDVFAVLAGFDDDSVGVVRAYDFLEHLPTEAKVRIMNEVHRVLAPDGMFLTLTPSSEGRGAWQDPTHLSAWNENAHWYWTDAAYARYVPELTARFQTSRAVTFFPSAFHEEHQIPYVQANLICLKNGGGVRNGGYLRW